MSESRKAFEAWAQTQGAPKPGWWLRQLPDGGYSCHEADIAWKAWTASRAAALEEAEQACGGVLDMKEEARAEQASRDARGTPDELDRLKHWATVSTFNAGIRRCIAAIRSLSSQAGKEKGE